MHGIFIFVNITRSYDEIIQLICAREDAGPPCVLPDLCKTEIETSNNNSAVEYMLNKVSVHVFVSSSKKFMKSVLKQSIICVLLSNSLNDFQC